MGPVIPKIIHFVVPKVPNEYQLEIIRIARSLHESWDIRVWYGDDLPSDSRLAHYLMKAPTGAQRADLIRLEKVFAFGGFYLDADIRLLHALDQFVDSGAMLVCSEDGFNLTNAFFAAPPHHGALDRVIETLVKNEPDWTLPPNETTGPGLFTSVLRYRSDVFVLPREAFYPYNWNQARPSLLPPTCVGVHEWAGSWKRKTKTLAPSWYRRISREALKKPARSLRPFMRRALAGVLDRALEKLQAKSGGVYSMQADLVALTKYGIRMALPGSDLSVTPSIALTGEFEPSEEAFVRRVVRGGDWVIDVGANVGVHTLLAALSCGPFGRVFSIEPNEKSRHYIRISSLLNWFHDRISILEFAASDDNGERLLEGSMLRLGDWKLRGNGSTSDAFQLTSQIAEDCPANVVQTRTLADAFPLNVPIKLMKIDAEGHEAAILRGAHRLFKTRGVQHLMIEASRETSGLQIGELLDALRQITSFGYRASALTWNGSLRTLQRFEEHIPSTGHVNLVFSAQWEK